MRTIFLSYITFLIKVNAMSARTVSRSTQAAPTTNDESFAPAAKFYMMLWAYWPSMATELEQLLEADDPAAVARQRSVVMGQMGAKRIGSLAIGIAVVGIVLNQMSSLDVVANSTGVIDVSGIFDVAGAGLNLLVIGVIIAAAAVLLSLWSGF